MNNYVENFSKNKLSELHYAIMKVWDSEYEILIKEIFESEKIKSFLDLGANTGCVIEYLHDFFDDDVTIIGFEPAEENFNFLKEVVAKINRNNRSKLYKKAVFYGSKKLRAFGVGDSSTAGLFLEGTLSIINPNDHRKPVPTEYVFDCTTLEDELFDVDSIDLCKIDVEGSEYNIIENSSFLKEKVKNILLEYHWKNEKEIMDWLTLYLPSHKIFKLGYDKNDSTNGKECSMIWLKKIL